MEAVENKKVRIAFELVHDMGKIEKWNCGTQYIKMNAATYRVEDIDLINKFFYCVDVTEEHAPIREELRDENTFGKYYDKFHTSQFIVDYDEIKRRYGINYTAQFVGMETWRGIPTS